MKMLYERQRKCERSELIPFEQPKRILNDVLAKSYIFRIDNVAEYYWLAEKDGWSITTDFPVLTPPFENTYF